MVKIYYLFMAILLTIANYAVCHAFGIHIALSSIPVYQLMIPITFMLLIGYLLGSIIFD